MIIFDQFQNYECGLLATIHNIKWPGDIFIEFGIKWKRTNQWFWNAQYRYSYVCDGYSNGVSCGNIGNWRRLIKISGYDHAIFWWFMHKMQNADFETVFFFEIVYFFLLCILCFDSIRFEANIFFLVEKNSCTFIRSFVHSVGKEKWRLVFQNYSFRNLACSW